MQCSVLLPYSPVGGEETAGYARLVADGLGARLWLGQTTYAEPHQVLAFLAGAGVRIPSGTAVTLTPLRHPYEAALQARSIALLSGRPHVAGYGQGATAFVQALRGSTYASPLAAVDEYLTVVRACLTGEPVEFEGEYQTLHFVLPAASAPLVELGVGVLREKMARLAGRRADVAITWLAPRRHLRDVLLPALEAGGAEHGRARPRVASIVPFALSGPGRKPWRRAFSSCGTHLQMPHYRSMLRSSGVAVDDLKTALRDIVSGGTFLWGTAEEVADRLRAWEELGIEEVILNASGTHYVDGPEEAVESLREVLTAWRAPTAAAFTDTAVAGAARS